MRQKKMPDADEKNNSNWQILADVCMFVLTNNGKRESNLKYIQNEKHLVSYYIFLMNIYIKWIN